MKENKTINYSTSIYKEVLWDIITPMPCLVCKENHQIKYPKPLKSWTFPSLWGHGAPNCKQHKQQYCYWRPYFTMWLLVVDILILVTAVCSFSFAPVGSTWKPISKQLIRYNLAYETVVYRQQENFWIGPDYQDLIHFGAKYSPCMRRDVGVSELVRIDQEIEDRTGCCVRDDLNVCWQTHTTHCTSAFATFHSDKVCGLAKEYCTDINIRTNNSLWDGPKSTWPNCPVLDRSNISKKLFPSLACEVSGRPCCIGLQGECIIVSEEECAFRNGYFHPNNTLCSQIECMEMVCGIDVSKMYQFYRILLPTFMHAGILHLIITLLFLVFIVVPIECSYGWLRTGLIYISSGLCGTMFSAFFTPYQPEVGPAGAMFGMFGLHIAANLVQLRDWHDLSHLRRTHSFRKTLVFLFICCMLFLPGLLPWIDNWSHLGGLIFGFLISLAVLPHRVSKDSTEWNMRLILRISFLVVAVLLVVLQVYLFYFKQDLFRDVHWPSYFNCIPFTAEFCQDACMELRPRLKAADRILGPTYFTNQTIHN